MFTFARRVLGPLLAGLACGLPVTASASSPPSRAAGEDGPLRLRVVGSLGSLRLFTQHEQPFWTHHLLRASGGRITAEIVPADRAGIGVTEQLPLVQAGALPFSVIQVATAPEFGAVDLAGVNPDMASLRRSAAAFRPLWDRLLRERHGAELLAVYTYPAQVLFCRRAWTGGLAGLKGLRIRTSSPASPTGSKAWARCRRCCPSTTSATSWSAATWTAPSPARCPATRWGCTT